MSEAPSPDSHAGAISMSSPITPPIRSHDDADGRRRYRQPQQQQQQKFLRKTSSPSSSSSSSQHTFDQDNGDGFDTRRMKSTFPTSAYFPLPVPHKSTVNPAAYSPHPSYVEPPSYHEVEPRSSSTVPRPFTIDGDTLPSQGWSTSTMPTTTAAAAARPRSTYVLSHDPNELEFPSTLEILWDRTPLRAPIIVPHDRLLPSLWVSRQTMISLGESLPYLGGGRRDSRREGKQQDQQDQRRQLGLLVGRASFPGRALGQQEHDGSSNRVPPTFMADARPVVCLDLFDPGRRLAKINESNARDGRGEGEEGEDREEEMLVPSNETLFNTKRNVVEIVVTRNTKAASTTTTTSSSSSSSSSSSNVAIASKTLRAQVVALTEACSSGSVQRPRRASPTTGTMVETDVLHVPGSGLWSIVCTVGDSNEGKYSSSSSSSSAAGAAGEGVPRTMPVKFSVVMPAISLGFTMIQSLPLVTSPMTSQLLHGGTNIHTTTTKSTTKSSSSKHGEFEHGLLTLNQVRRAVPILSDDPLIHRLPMIGAWIQLPLDTFQVLQQTAMTTTMAAASLNRNEPTPPSLQRVLTDPAVWSACCRYLYDPCLTRATSGADVNHFLLAIFPTKVTRPGTPRSPIFLEVSVLAPLGKEEDSSSSSSSSSNRRQQRTYNGRPSMPVVRNLNLLVWLCHKKF